MNNSLLHITGCISTTDNSHPLTHKRYNLTPFTLNTYSVQKSPNLFIRIYLSIESYRRVCLLSQEYVPNEIEAKTYELKPCLNCAYGLYMQVVV